MSEHYPQVHTVIAELRAENERLHKDVLHWEHQNGLLEAENEQLRLYIKDLQINSPAQAVIDENKKLRADLRLAIECAPGRP